MAKCSQDLSSMFWCDVYLHLKEYLRLAARLFSLIQCVVSSAVSRHRSWSLGQVWRQRLVCPLSSTLCSVHTSPVLHITIVHITTSCLQRSTTLLRPWCGCWIYTGCLSLRAVCPLVPRPHLETGSLARQPTQYFAGFLLRISTNSCLLSRSFFLFPFVSLLFSCLRACQCSGTDGRPRILEVGLHHDVPAVLDHGEGEQDHTPSHHASKKVRFGL